MRIVLDTNVLARAFAGGSGPAAEVLRRALRPPNLMILSPFLLGELARVLRYPRVQQLHGRSDVELQSLLIALKESALIVTVETPADQIVTTDPDDDPVIATAVAGQAETLVTLDRHLRQPQVVSYCQRHGISVQTDVELLSHWRQDESTETG